MTTRRKGVSFKTTREERELIVKIIKRAGKLVPNLDKMSLNMDVTACHANGNPLKLAELLAADDFNFAHDVFGIARHIDRKTGKLLHCFLPRFTARKDG